MKIEEYDWYESDIDSKIQTLYRSNCKNNETLFTTIMTDEGVIFLYKCDFGKFIFDYKLDNNLPNTHRYVRREL